MDSTFFMLLKFDPSSSFHSHCLSPSHCSTFGTFVYLPTEVLSLPPHRQIINKTSIWKKKKKHQYDHIFFLGKRVQSLPTAFRVSSKFLSRVYKGLHIWCHHCPLPPLLWALLEFQSWSFSVQSPFLALDSLAGNSFFRFTIWLNKSCKTYPPTSSPKPGNLAQVVFLSEPCAHMVHNTVGYPRFTCLLPPPLQENYCVLGHQGQVPHFICASHILRAQ